MKINEIKNIIIGATITSFEYNKNEVKLYIETDDSPPSLMTVSFETKNIKIEEDTSRSPTPRVI